MKREPPVPDTLMDMRTVMKFEEMPGEPNGVKLQRRFLKVNPTEFLKTLCKQELAYQRQLLAWEQRQAKASRQKQSKSDKKEPELDETPEQSAQRLIDWLRE